MENTREVLIKGLTANPKYIPAWFRYDQRGSELNDKCIEESKHYYFHRSEVELLKDIFKNHRVGANSYDVLVDLGSGNAYKTRFFLQDLVQSDRKPFYVPVDISAEYLRQTADQIKQEYKNLHIDPIAKDYLKAMKEIRERYSGKKKMIWFSGGVMNLPSDLKRHFLHGMQNLMEDDDILILTFDVTNPNNKTIIENAYLDPDGYAKALHMNNILRLNVECGGDIDESQFDIFCEFIKQECAEENSYVNVWVEAKHSGVYCIEKLNLKLNIDKGEKIYLHNDGGVSSKFTIEQITFLLSKTSLSIEEMWTNQHVALVLCKAV